MFPVGVLVAKVQIRVECRFLRDMLQGDDVNEIRYELPTAALSTIARAAGHDDGSFVGLNRRLQG